MLKHLANIPAFVILVKRWLANHAATHLAQMQRGYQHKDAYELGWKLFSSLQALSYLEETQDGVYKAAGQKQIVSYILSLIDLEEVALEPYNLYYRPTIASAQTHALYGNDAFIGVPDLLQVGAGIYVKDKILPQVFDALPTPTCCPA